MKKYFTLTKADMYNVALEVVFATIHSSHEGGLCVAVEDEHYTLINSINKIEHESLEVAKKFAEEANSKININSPIYPVDLSN